MKTITTTMEEATAEQLRWYCRNVLQLDGISDKNNKSHLMAKIANAGITETEIEVPAPQPKAPPVTLGESINPRFTKEQAEAFESESAISQADPEAHLPKYADITLLAKDEAGGSRPKFVAVNLKGMIIPRGEMFRVPYRYYEVLENSKKIVYEKTKENPGIGEPREVHENPFILHGFAAEPTKNMVNSEYAAPDQPDFQQHIDALEAKLDAVMKSVGGQQAVEEDSSA